MFGKRVPNCAKKKVRKKNRQIEESILSLIETQGKMGSKKMYTTT